MTHHPAFLFVASAVTAVSRHTAGLLLTAAAALACSVIINPSQAQTGARLPVGAFFERPVYSGALLSPSGERVAFRLGGKGQRDSLAVLDLSTLKMRKLTASDETDVNTFQWVNDQRLVFTLRESHLAAGDTFLAPGLFAINADGSGLRQLVLRGGYRKADQRELPWNTFLLPQVGAQDSDWVYVVRPDAVTDKGFDYFDLQRLNTVSGLTQDVDTPKKVVEWLLDDKGELRAVRTGDGAVAALHLRDPATGNWRKLREYDRFGTGADIQLQGLAADGQLIVTARAKRDVAALYLYDPVADRLADKPLLAVAQYDVEPQLIQAQGRLLGAQFTADAQVTHWFDATLKQHQADVDKALPTTSNLLQPPRRGNSPWILVHAFSDVQPAMFLLFNTGTKKLTRIGAERPDIQTNQMSTMDMVRYKARDGLEIPAYLTLPASAPDKKNLPLIVYVHGGPWLRGATWRWQPDVQFLASRGYAVLQPEFRGSLGFGLKHFESSFKQWGLAMQDDLADGARWAIAQGIADPQRICIMGASYGGYATLMGLAKDGDLFKCGINWVGVSDILLMYDATWSDSSDVWKRYGMPLRVGDRKKDMSQLEATSPIKLAARIKNPLLVGHGRVDRRVPVEHGQRLVDAVSGHNPNVEWVRYADEGHGWSLPATEVDWWTRVEKFLSRHMPAGQ
jgi:dipeptidyl aminopeptidase/acylaminoacyl peptidase